MSKKDPKKLGLIALGTTAVLIVAVMIFFSFGVKGLVEKVASYTLQTKVQIGSLDISPRSKEISVSDVRIHNVNGFNQTYLLRVKDILIKAEQLTGDTIIMDTIDVTGMEVTYEVTEKGSNLGTLKNNLKSSGSTPESEKTSKKSKPVVIKKLKITDSKIIPAIKIGDVKQDQPISLPDIKMTNIGSKSNPKPLAAAITQILNKIISTTITTASREGLTGKIDDLKGQIGDKVKGLFGN